MSVDDENMLEERDVSIAYDAEFMVPLVYPLVLL